MSGQRAVEASDEHETVSDLTEAVEDPTPPTTDGPNEHQLKLRLVVADACAASFAIVLTFQVQMFFKPVPRYIAMEHLLLIAVAAPFFAVGAVVNRLYQSRANESRTEEFRNIVKTIGMGIGCLLAVAFVVQYSALSRLWVVLLAGSMTLALVIERHFARNIFSRLRATGQISRRIVIVGTDPHAVALLHTYERHPELGYEVVGFVGDDELGRRCGVEVLGPITELPGALRAQRATGVVVSLASVESVAVNAVTRQLTELGYHVALSSSLVDIDITRLRPQQLDGRTMIYVEPVVRGGWRAMAKRLFDIVLGSVIFILSLPVLLAAAIAIRIDSRGPIFFHQTRVGKNGELFRLTKLRTMVVDAEQLKEQLNDMNEADGALFKIRDDPRITRVGRVLRRLSIDELPQLFSVLRGSMSLVGPRPALPEEVAKWDEGVAERLRVLPGLTGLWQVSGRSNASFESYKRLDSYYVDNWSLRHDLSICAKTLKAVLVGDGAA